jgi:hypothetical protein
MATFHALASGAVDVSDIMVHGAVQNISFCRSGVRFNNDGTISRITGGAADVFNTLGDDQTGYHANGDVSSGAEVDHTGQWWTNAPEASIGELYQFRIQTVDSGSFDLYNDFGTGVYGDIDLAPKIGSNRTGGKGGQGLGTDIAVATCQIRLKASPFTVLATFQVTTQSHRGGTPS